MQRSSAFADSYELFGRYRSAIKENNPRLPQKNSPEGYSEGFLYVQQGDHYINFFISNYVLCMILLETFTFLNSRTLDYT